MKISSISALALTAALGISATTASAGCDQVGTTITCTGTETDGFKDSTDGLELTVAPAAQVSNGSKDTIKMKGDGNKITVGTGAVIESGDEAITVGKAAVINNAGTITADDNVIDAEEQDDLTLINTAVIKATPDGRKGVKADDAKNVTIYNALGAVIQGETEGIETGDDLFVENYGTIAGVTDDALNPAENAVILNYGTILGGDDGIDIDSGLIENGGLIKAADAAIDVDAADNGLTVNNSGTIKGVTGILVEDGTNDPANTMTQTIANRGSLVGTGGTAVYLAGGNDVFKMDGAGSLIGDVLMGDGDDSVTLGGTEFSVSAGSVFDGGEGVDLLELYDLIPEDFAGLSLNGAQFSFDFVNGSTGEDMSLSFLNFENFKIDGTLFSFDELAAAVAPVPLPAPVLLLGAALAGLAGMRRRA